MHSCMAPTRGLGDQTERPPSPAPWTLTGPGHGMETAVLLLSPREVRLQLTGLGDRAGGSFSPPEMKAQNIPEARAEGRESEPLQQSPLRVPTDSPATAPGCEAENTNRIQ